MKIMWTEHRSNQEVLDMVDEKFDEHHPTKTEKLVRSCNLRSESLLLRRQNGMVRNSWEAE